MTSHDDALAAIAHARRTSSLNPPTQQDRPNEVPPPRHRVIVDTDAANEADDQYAIVHALLSPTLDVRGIIAAHFGLRRTSSSMQASREEIDRILALMGDTSTQVADGAPTWIPDERTPIDSDGARLIIQEALSDDGPLTVAFLGPLTNMASAILLEPTIIERDVTVIWIGGPPYGDQLGRTGAEAGIEFNLSNDIDAANVVFSSGIRLVQVPESTYRMCSVGYAELRQKVEPHGELGAYLVQQLVAWNDRWNTTSIERRSLGDSPAIGLMLNPGGGVMRRVPAPRFAADGSLVDGRHDHLVTVCETFDMRYLFEDMFAKISEFGARSGA